MKCTSNSNRRTLLPSIQPPGGKCPLAHSRLLGPRRSYRQGGILGGLVGTGASSWLGRSQRSGAWPHMLELTLPGRTTPESIEEQFRVTPWGSQGLVRGPRAGAFGG